MPCKKALLDSNTKYYGIKINHDDKNDDDQALEFDHSFDLVHSGLSATSIAVIFADTTSK